MLSARIEINFLPFSGSDPQSTLKSLVVKSLQKERNFHATADKLRFQNPALADNFSNAVTKAYHTVHSKGLLYKLLPETLCHFDRIFRKNLSVIFCNFIAKSSQISTEGNSNDSLDLECDEIPHPLDFATN